MYLVGHHDFYLNRFSPTYHAYAKAFAKLRFHHTMFGSQVVPFKTALWKCEFHIIMARMARLSCDLSVQIFVLCSTEVLTRSARLDTGWNFEVCSHGTSQFVAYFVSMYIFRPRQTGEKLFNCCGALDLPEIVWKRRFWNAFVCLESKMSNDKKNLGGWNPTQII